MVNYRNPLNLLPFLSFLIPVNIWIAGDRLGTGVQWILFRYQQIPGGDISLVSFTRDTGSVLSGFIRGHCDPGMILWSVAVCLLIGSFIIALFSLGFQKPAYLKKTAFIAIICGILLALSDVIQYGFSLQGPEGFCIPAGIPVILFLGWWTYRMPLMPEPGEKDDDDIRTTKKTCFLSVELSGFDTKTAWSECATLVIIAVIVKILVLSAALSTLLTILTGDMTLYHWYTQAILRGQIPYIDFNVDYPQLFLVPVLLAYIPVFFSPGFTTYVLSFAMLMVAFDIATLICVYILAARFFGREKAFHCGLLYTTAISAAFFVPITYDPVPTFFLVFSLFLYIHKKEIAAYLSAATGVLLKWFSVFCFPLFFLHTIKKKQETISFKTGIFLSGVLALLCFAPFVFMNPRSFFTSYSFHFTRMPEAHSFIYYLDAISRSFGISAPFGTFSFVLLVIVECVLVLWYFRSLSTGELTLSYILFLSVFLFVLFNKVFSAYYILWLTPFLALFLCHSFRHIVLFYLIQAIMYLEAPVLLRVVYTPGKYYTVIEHSLPSLTFLFYTVKFLIFFIVLYVIVRDINVLHRERERINN